MQITSKMRYTTSMPSTELSTLIQQAGVDQSLVSQAVSEYRSPEMIQPRFSNLANLFADLHSRLLPSPDDPYENRSESDGLTEVAHLIWGLYLLAYQHDEETQIAQDAETALKSVLKVLANANDSALIEIKHYPEFYKAFTLYASFLEMK